MRFLKKLLILSLLNGGILWAQPSPNIELREEESLVLEVHLENTVIADSLILYKHAKEVFFPLRELMRVLSLAVDVDLETKRAEGWVLQEDRKFLLDLNKTQLIVDGKKEKLSVEKIVLHGDDIYVASSQITQWFPIDINIEESSLLLKVSPREKLPIQDRLERMKLAQRLESQSDNQSVDPGYPQSEIPYKWIDTPTLDQRLSLNLIQNKNLQQRSLDYSTFATGDFLGTEGALYLSADQKKKINSARLTMSRHDPEAQLLGPLKARSVSGGAVALPGHSLVATPSSKGVGAHLSNRPFDLPSEFDKHSISGILLPGWDIILFQNGVPLRFQQYRDDGRFEFNNLPLLFGANDFKLVFHGPLGEERVEHYRFFLDGSLIRPGEYFYDVGLSATQDGTLRSTMQFDKSLGSHSSVAGSFWTLPVDNRPRSYTGLGLRSFWESFFLGTDFLKSDKKGFATEANVKTHVGTIMLGGSHAILKDYESEIFLPTSDPVISRTKLRSDFSLPLWNRLPVALETKMDRQKSGMNNYDFLAKISTYILNSSVSLLGHGQVFNKYFSSDLTLMVTRRLGRLGLQSEINYLNSPVRRLNSAVLSVETKLGARYLLNQTLTRAFLQKETRFTAGLNKILGPYAFGASLGQSSKGETTVGLQFFLALGFEPRKTQVVTDATSMTQSGAASVLVFLDKNSNGVRDSNEEALEGVGFKVDGQRHPTKTNAEGIANLQHLPIRKQVDLGLDPSTLEDLRLTPKLRGLRFVPRPGRALEIEFPILSTIEIDGNIRLQDKKTLRPVADVEIELCDVNDNDRVVAQTKSASDGFYILNQVPPGTYKLRINEDQSSRLKIKIKETNFIEVKAEGDFISGIDRTLIPQ